MSPAYLSLIENGHKVPGEAVALAIAGALGADLRLFRAWIAARKSAQLDDAIEAAETLRAYRSGGPADAALATAVAPEREAALAANLTPTFTRLRIPVIAEGNDPGDGVRPACPILEWRSLDTTTLSAAARARLDRPVAIRLGAAAGGVGLAPGDHALVLRGLADLPPECVCAVRIGPAVALRRVIWDGGRLLVLPPPGEASFEVVEAGPESLRARVVGIARRIAFG